MSGIMNSIYNNTLFALSRHTEALFGLQEQATTGSRINRPSDDPTASASILNLQSENAVLENYLNTLAEAVSTLNISSSVLQQITSALNQVKTSITQVTSGTYDDASRQRTAEAIDNTLEQLVQLANTKNNGQYLFGGSDTNSAPFVVERTNGKITSVTYQGSSENLNINVAPRRCIKRVLFRSGFVLLRRQKHTGIFRPDGGRRGHGNIEHNRQCVADGCFRRGKL
jgi:flagellar hook-associated protein 3 FlgL